MADEVVNPAPSKRAVGGFSFSSPPLDFSKSIDTSVLKGQGALVTGGANGIGAGFVQALAEAGAYVTIADLHPDGEKYAKELSDKGYHVQFIQCDVRSWDSQIKAFKTAIAFHPTHSLDIVATPAGLVGRSIAEYLKENKLDANGDPLPPTTSVIDVNLTGSYYSVHLALYYFGQTVDADTTARSKQIVLVASLAGYGPIPLVADYNASKFGVRGMMKSVRERPDVLGEGKKKVRTNLIAPTYIRTRMIQDHAQTLTNAGIPVAEVEDVTDAFVRIVTDEDVHGRCIAIASDKKNVDLHDELDHFDGGKKLRELIDGGLFGSGQPKITVP